MYVAGTHGLTISEIVSREIDPMLFSSAHNGQFLQTEHRDIVTCLTQLMAS